MEYTVSNTALNRQIWLVVCCLVLCICGSCARAEQVAGLYDVTLPVVSQSKQALNNATQQGLQAVFVRISGSESVIGEPKLRAAITGAKAYMKQFRYKRQRMADGESQLFVSLEFEPKQVDRALREAGSPIWSSNRPTVLVWVVVDGRRGTRRFASSADHPELIDAINKHATRRGLAIKLPLLDLEDNLSVTPEQFWRLGSRQTQLAIDRYRADTVLVGRVSQLHNGQWLGKWSYRYNERRVNFDGEAKDVDQYISTAVSRVADMLAADYAIAPVNIAKEGLLMRISGISGFTQYARAIKYLEGLAAIRHANVVDIQGNDIIVRLEADGLMEQLQRSLALDNYLQPSVAGPYQGNYAISLDYQWPQSGG